MLQLRRPGGNSSGTPDAQHAVAAASLCLSVAERCKRRCRSQQQQTFGRKRYDAAAMMHARAIDVQLQKGGVWM